MTDPIDPIRGANGDRRRRARRQADAPPPPQASSNLPAVQPVPAPESKTTEPKPTLAAHLLGQDGQKRGLRGGPETLAKAKTAYLNAEWSGRTDRRLTPGLISKTKI
jgi:hypothetical protein